MSLRNLSRAENVFELSSSDVLTVCANCTSMGVYPRLERISGMPKASVSSSSCSRVLASSVLRWMPSIIKNGLLSAILYWAASSTIGSITLMRAFASEVGLVFLPSLVLHVEG